MLLGKLKGHSFCLLIKKKILENSHTWYFACLWLEERRVRRVSWPGCYSSWPRVSSSSHPRSTSATSYSPTTTSSRMYRPSLRSPCSISAPRRASSLTGTHIVSVSLVLNICSSFMNLQNLNFNFFSIFFCHTHSHALFWGHWYPCFGFLVTSPLGFKAREGSFLFAFILLTVFHWDSMMI